MPENVTLNAGAVWRPEAVAKLRALWEGGVPAAQIAAVLGRPEAEIGAKALELRFQRPREEARDGAR
ncbi:MAG: hypothetical protein AB7M12_02365 [Hyphomonadaceae bacterium]